MISAANPEETIGKKVIGTRWVLKLKGVAIKARLVVQDFNNGTTDASLYASTLNMSSLRALIALPRGTRTIHRRGSRGGMATADISSAFMHSDLPTEKGVYIRSPGEMPSDSKQGSCVHEVRYHDRVIWKVHKAMNGLRQSPRLFQDHLAQQLSELGCTRLVSDTSSYTNKETRVSIVVHVDDLTLAGPVTNMKKMECSARSLQHAND